MAMHKKEALIIDDDQDICNLAKKILEGVGITVHTFNSVDEAMLFIERRPPRVILVDLQMPQVSGFDFLEKRKAHPSLHLIPVLVLSGLKDRASVTKAFSLGANDYVIKPFQANILIQKIRKASQDKSFPKVDASQLKNKKVAIHFKGSITSIGEVSLMLEAPVNFAPNTSVKLESTFLDELSTPIPHFKTSQKNSRFTGHGLYVTDVNFVGLTHETAKKLRLSLRNIK